MNLLPLHVAGGVLAVAAGFAALYSGKGGTLHRRSGTIFVYAILSMTFSGTLMAATGRAVSAANVVAGLLTTYLVVTALTTVSPPSARVRRLDRGAMLAALALGLFCVGSAFALLTTGGPGTRGLAVALLIVGVIPLLASAGDRRMIRAGGLRGASRIRRHLWRMCAALFIATASIVLGRRFPEPLRILPIRLIPFVVLVTMIFWLWRFRRRRASRDVAAVGLPEAV